jgi:hypothetical protein
MICIEYLVDLLVIDLRFRNRREKIYKNVIFSKNIWYIIFFNLMENI